MADRIQRKLQTIVYPKVYQILLKEIEYKRRTGRNYHKYIVPTHISGHPNYNLIDCIKFLILRLKNNKYDVYYVQPNKLIILWNPYDNIIRLKDNLQFLYDEHIRTQEFKNKLNSTEAINYLINNSTKLSIEPAKNKLSNNNDKLPELPSPNIKNKKFPNLKI